MEFKEYVNSLPNQRNEVIAQLAIRCCVTSTDGYVGILSLMHSREK